MMRCPNILNTTSPCSPISSTPLDVSASTFVIENLIMICIVIAIAQIVFYFLFVRKPKEKK